MIWEAKPLSENEQLFRQMYRKYPQLSLESPHKLEELEDATRNLPEYRKIKHMNPAEFPSTAEFDEHGFAERTSVTTVLHERFSPCFVHEHDFFEIIYVLNGECTNYIAGKPQRYKQGDICIIAPHTKHAISAFDEKDVILNILIRSSTFRETFFASFQNKDVLSVFFSRALQNSDGTSHLFFSTGEDAKLRSLAAEIARETAAGSRFAERISSTLVSLFFLYLLRNHEQDLEVPNPSGKEADGNIVFILNYVMSHYNNITLSELASFFNYSERQMTRLLKDYTGESFTGIVQKARLEKAREMLQFADIPIPDIVAEIGYSNASHFYTLFKKQYGMTPAAYREQCL